MSVAVLKLCGWLAGNLTLTDLKRAQGVKYRVPGFFGAAALWSLGSRAPCPHAAGVESDPETPRGARREDSIANVSRSKNVEIAQTGVFRK